MANRDTTITLLLKGNAAALNAALQQSSRQVRGFATEAEQAGSRSHRQFDHIRASVASISTQLAQAKTQLIAFVGLQSVGDAVGRLVERPTAMPICRPRSSWRRPRRPALIKPKRRSLRSRSVRRPNWIRPPRCSGA
ncbi:hypothetical protein ABU614_06710 [Lysobacter firmicutimachus]|uniref:Uncharacterized protein n=1 Tax=Lysobacter firmicutimachus TaxID=1792846 RepID=A0AAU8MY98_9GAMM